MAATATGAKYCCKCGTDVTTIQRMRDSGGRYWCLSCGQKDQRTKAANTGAICTDCGEMFPTSQLTRMSGSPYCAKCLKEKHKKSGGAGGGLSALLSLKQYLPSSSGDEEAGRRKKMTIMLVVLLAAIVAVNYWLR